MNSLLSLLVLVHLRPRLVAAGSPMLYVHSQMEVACHREYIVNEKKEKRTSSQIDNACCFGFCMRNGNQTIAQVS